MTGRPRSLTDTQLAQIRERRAAGEKYYSIAVDLGVHEQTVRRWCGSEYKPEIAPVIGPHKTTPYLDWLITYPPRKWTHVRRYRSRAYAVGVMAVFAERWADCEFDAIGTAVWMRAKR
jgi:transposase